LVLGKKGYAQFEPGFWGWWVETPEAVEIRGLQISGSLVPDCKSGTAGFFTNRKQMGSYIFINFIL